MIDALDEIIIARPASPIITQSTSHPEIINMLQKILDALDLIESRTRPCERVISEKAIEAEAQAIRSISAFTSPNLSPGHSA